MQSRQHERAAPVWVVTTAGATGASASGHGSASERLPAPTRAGTAERGWGDRGGMGKPDDRGRDGVVPLRQPPALAGTGEWGRHGRAHACHPDGNWWLVPNDDFIVSPCIGSSKDVSFRYEETISFVLILSPL